MYRYRWTSASTQDQLQLRQQLLVFMRNVSRDALIYNNSSCNKIVLNDEFVYTKHSFTHMQRDEGGLNIIINTVIDRGE